MVTNNSLKSVRISNLRHHFLYLLDKVLTLIMSLKWLEFYIRTVYFFLQYATHEDEWKVGQSKCHKNKN